MIEGADVAPPQDVKAPFSRDIALSDADSAVILTIRDNVPTFTFVDLNDGGTTKAENICADIAAFQSEVLYSPFELYARQQDELVLKSFRTIYSYNLSTQTCSMIGAVISITRSLNDIAMTSQGQWYFSSQGGVFQFETESGQSVIISK